LEAGSGLNSKDGDRCEEFDARITGYTTLIGFFARSCWLPKTEALIGAAKSFEVWISSATTTANCFAGVYTGLRVIATHDDDESWSTQ